MNGKQLIEHLFTLISYILPFVEINLKKLVKFGVVNATRTSSPYELDAYVPLNKLRRTATFKLKLYPEVTDQSYNVFVRAERKADVFLGNYLKKLWNNLAILTAALH